MKNSLVRKLTSRKLWVSIAGFVGMLITANGGSENEAAQITAIIMAGATVISYVFGEGFADGMNAGIGEGIELEQAVDMEDEEECV